MDKTKLWRIALPCLFAALGLFLLFQNVQAAAREKPAGRLEADAEPTNVIVVTSTIQAAINAAANGDIVSIPSGFYTESLTVDKDLTLRGVSSSATILIATPGHRVITVPGGHTLRLEGVYVTDGDPTGSGGGGIYATGGLKIINSIIGFNQATYGGGIFQDNAGARVEVENSYIQANYAQVDGGGFYVTGDLVITDTYVVGNIADRHGGGGHVQNGSVKMVRGSLGYNNAGGNGGGLNTNNGVSILGTFIYNNTAEQDGGGVLQWNPGWAVDVTDATFRLNRAYGNGGGLWARGNLTVTQTTVMTNTAGPASGTSNFYGGGIYLSTGSISVSSSAFRGNKFDCTLCFTQGGGLYIDTTKPASVVESTFEKNNAWIGAGIEYTQYDLLVNGSTFKGNRGGYGGGIDFLGGNIMDTDFINNYAVNRGGGIRAGSMVQVSDSRFISNTASYGGGGAVEGLTRLQAVNTLFVDNHSIREGSVLMLRASGASSLQQVTITSHAQEATQAITVSNGTLSITNTLINNYHIGISAGGGSQVFEDYNLFFGNWADYDIKGGVIHYGVHDIAMQDPLFVNSPLFDYHLRLGSPAINKGKVLGILTDLDGNPRDAKPDIGAYEYRAHIYLPALKK